MPNAMDRIRAGLQDLYANIWRAGRSPFAGRIRPAIIIGLVHVIIVAVTVMFIAYLIVCTVRSLRVTVTINKVLSYLIILPHL